MMLYTIIQSFSSTDVMKWVNYTEWRGVNFERFDSIDGILRPSLYEPEEDIDWLHVVNENFKLHLITDLKFARLKHKQIGKGDIVGLAFENHDVEHESFLGFDIIDGYCDVSLLTNWGNDVEVINQSLASNALVKDFCTAKKIFELLKENWGDDPHVESCRIVSIYSV